MFSVRRFLKLVYILVLGTVVLVLSKPSPVRAQRTIAYPFLPYANFVNVIPPIYSSPINSIAQAQLMLSLSGLPLSPLGFGLGAFGQAGAGLGAFGQLGFGGGVNGFGFGAIGLGGFNGFGLGGFNGFGLGGFNGFGLAGGFNGFGLAGGFNGFGLAGGFNGLGLGAFGLGGFAGKGFGGFNGKNAL